MSTICPPILKERRNRLSIQRQPRRGTVGGRSCGAESGESHGLRAQLPTLAPMLDEVEIAGWSSHNPEHPANFHDWMLLDSGLILFAAGYASRPNSEHAGEMGLATQLVWTALRAHALHVTDASEMMALVSRTICTSPSSCLAALAIGLIQPLEGWVDLAIAGDCLGMRIRAASCRELEAGLPELDGTRHVTGLGQRFQLQPRERLTIVAHPRASQCGGAIRNEFAMVTSEEHRKMTATKALSHVRQSCLGVPMWDERPTSVIVVRRR